jgi:hypothetical protein
MQPIDIHLQSNFWVQVTNLRLEQRKLWQALIAEI